MNMIEAHPDVAADPRVRALARHIAIMGLDDEDDIERRVHACADATGFEAAILWDVLPELSEAWALQA